MKRLITRVVLDNGIYVQSENLKKLARYTKGSPFCPIRSNLDVDKVIKEGKKLTYLRK